MNTAEDNEFEDRDRRYSYKYEDCTDLEKISRWGIYFDDSQDPRKDI